MDFKKFKENRSKLKSALSKMREEREKNNSSGPTPYYPKLDKMGNANVVVRVLPQKDMNKHPIEIVYRHQYSVGESYFSKLCPSTFGNVKDCEFCQELSAAWSQAKKAGVDRPTIPGYRSKKRIINVLVVKDANQPDLEGKVMRMYIASTLEDKINRALFPPKNEDGTLTKQPKIIHDMWEGFNLNIEIQQNSKGYSDYSESHFDVEPTPVAKTEKEIEDIFNAIEDLTPDRTNMLTGAQIKEAFNTFLKLNGEATLDSEEPKTETKPDYQEKREAEKALEEEFTTNVSDDDDDDEKMPWE